MRSQTLTTLLVLAFLGTPCVQAAECEITDTLDACWAASEIQKKENALQASETGVDTGGANLATTKKDFDSPLNLVALIGEQTSGISDEDGTLVLDLNSLLPGPLRNQGQLKVVLDTEATLFEPLEMSLQESGNEEVLDDVKDLLGGLGEYSVSFSYNARTEKLGRYVSNHRDLFGALVAPAIQQPLPAQDKFLGFLQTLQDVDACTDTETCNCEDAETCTFLELTGGDRSNARRLKAAFEEAVNEETILAQEQRRRIAAISENELKHFAALADNQPQLHFSLERKTREDLVGPDEWSGELTYEWPLAPNLNRLRKATSVSPSLDEFNGYIKTAKDRLDNSDRFSLSVKYLDRDSLDIDLPGDLENFTAESSRELILSLGWGRLLEANDDGTAKSWVDLKGSFEDVSSDPARTDRALVTLTVTRDFGNYSIPLGIVYSNKPEFLAMQDLDEQLSAHVGVKFNFDKDNKTK